jgi:hypothetical protein
MKAKKKSIFFFIFENQIVKCLVVHYYSKMPMSFSVFASLGARASLRG